VQVAQWIVPTGTLDVLDVQQDMLDAVMRRAGDQGITNITPTHGQAGDALPYPDDRFDAAYLVTVLGEIPEPEVALRELHRVLRPGGRLAVGEVLLDPDYTSLRELRSLAEAGSGSCGATARRSRTLPGSTRPDAAGSVGRLGPVTAAVRHHEQARALRQGLDHLSGEREHARFVRGAVTHGQRPASLGQCGEDAVERGAEPRFLGGDEIRIGGAERLEVGLPGLRVDLAPATLGSGAETGLDDDAAGHALTERGKEARQRLRRPLHARGNEQCVVAAQPGADLERGVHALLGQRVAVIVGVAPQLDGLGHARSGV
jgi:Methyltransferase domain